MPRLALFLGSSAAREAASERRHFFPNPPSLCGCSMRMPHLSFFGMAADFAVLNISSGMRHGV